MLLGVCIHQKKGTLLRGIVVPPPWPVRNCGILICLSCCTVTSGGWVLDRAPLLMHEAWPNEYMLNVTNCRSWSECRAPGYWQGLLHLPCSGPGPILEPISDVRAWVQAELRLGSCWKGHHQGSWSVLRATLLLLDHWITGKRRQLEAFWAQLQKAWWCRGCEARKEVLFWLC